MLPWQGVPPAAESEKAVEEVYDLLRNLPKYKAEILKEAIDGKLSGWGEWR